MTSRLLFGLALTLLNISSLFALEVPKLQRRVTDLAGLLTAQQIQSLEAKLEDLERTDSTQIALLIIPTLEGEVLEDYSHRVASTWELGQRGRDSGALLLIAMKERRVRIEVGYGLEGRLTDALSRRIIEDHIVPNFRQSNFYHGIDSGVTAMIQVVRGAYQAPARRPSGAAPQGGVVNLVPVFSLIIVFLFIFYASRRMGRRGGWATFPAGGTSHGGGFGGWGGGGGFSGGGGSFGGGGASGKW